jgi:hypothetical protein
MLMLPYTDHHKSTVLDACFCRLAFPRDDGSELMGDFRCALQSRDAIARNCRGVTGVAGGSNSMAKTVIESCAEKMLSKIRVSRGSVICYGSLFLSL